MVSDGSKYGCIDKTGKEILPLKYYTIDNFYDGVSRIGEFIPDQVLYGFADNNGKIIIKPENRNATAFLGNIYVCLKNAQICCNK